MQLKVCTVRPVSVCSGKLTTLKNYKSWIDYNALTKLAYRLTLTGRAINYSQWFADFDDNISWLVEILWLLFHINAAKCSFRRPEVSAVSCRKLWEQLMEFWKLSCRPTVGKSSHWPSFAYADGAFFLTECFRFKIICISNKYFSKFILWERAILYSVHLSRNFKSDEYTFRDNTIIFVFCLPSQGVFL